MMIIISVTITTNFYGSSRLTSGAAIPSGIDSNYKRGFIVNYITSMSVLGYA